MAKKSTKRVLELLITQKLGYKWEKPKVFKMGKMKSFQNLERSKVFKIAQKWPKQVLGIFDTPTRGGHSDPLKTVCASIRIIIQLTSRPLVKTRNVRLL